MHGSPGCGVEQAAWKRAEQRHSVTGLHLVPAVKKQPKTQDLLDTLWLGGFEDAEHGVPFEKGEEIDETELRAMWQLGWQGAKQKKPDDHLGGVRD